MSKSLRLSEKWFRRGLWLVALVFASFLIGLGSTIVGDLPRVERTLQLDDFIDQAAAEPLRATIRDAERTEQQATREREQAELAAADRPAGQPCGARDLRQLARDAARHRAARPGHRTDRAHQGARCAEGQGRRSAARGAVRSARSRSTRARRASARSRSSRSWKTMRARSSNAENRRVELRVFGYRLALTLPLLVIAGWLFAKKRKSTWWPFVWGFIYFALFAFFVELVPYLPSYGGYVRYVVGIVVTVLVGRYAIIALNRYLARQKLAEAQPDTVRRNELSYDTALARLAKSVCPGCERPVDLKNTEIDFCPHCGIGLFDHCRGCEARKSAFSQVLPCLRHRRGCRASRHCRLRSSRHRPRSPARCTSSSRRPRGTAPCWRCPRPSRGPAGTGRRRSPRADSGLTQSRSWRSVITQPGTIELTRMLGLAEVARQRAREAARGRLAGLVDRVAGALDHPADRAEVDDRSAAERAHVVGHRLRGEELVLEVDRHQRDRSPRCVTSAISWRRSLAALLSSTRDRPEARAHRGDGRARARRRRSRRIRGTAPRCSPCSCAASAWPAARIEVAEAHVRALRMEGAHQRFRRCRWRRRR